MALKLGIKWHVNIERLKIVCILIYKFDVSASFLLFNWAVSVNCWNIFYLVHGQIWQHVMRRLKMFQYVSPVFCVKVILWKKASWVISWRHSTKTVVAFGNQPPINQPIWPIFPFPMICRLPSYLSRWRLFAGAHKKTSTGVGQFKGQLCECQFLIGSRQTLHRQIHSVYKQWRRQASENTQCKQRL